MALTSYEANDIFVRQLAAEPVRSLSVGTPKRVLNDGNPTCRATRESSRTTSDDEIKLAGQAALVPMELEQHLLLNPNRLRTFEDVRLEIVTFCGGEVWFANP